VVAIALAALPARAQAACSISTTSIDFGTYSVYSSTADDSTGTVTYRCTTFELVVVVTLSPGASGSYAPRQMRRGGSPDRLDYNLFTTAARTTVWGDGTSGTSRHLGWLVAANRDVSLTVFGRIPPQQDVSVGTYTDTIIATIEF
jgi:spore coat protein U-like protein